MTSLRDAYPGSAHMAGEQQGLPLPPQGQMPHGAPGGTAAGSMDMKMPIKQMTTDDSRMPIADYLAQLEQEKQPRAAPQVAQQQDAYAAQMAQMQRQQVYQQQVAAAEAKMRGIARQESRFQSIGFIAIGMVIVFVAIFLMQVKGHVNLS